jgi:Amt family ammonium transporter
VVKGLFAFTPYAFSMVMLMADFLPLFALGAILMEAGMGRAKGATHSFVKGMVALGVGVLIGAVGGSWREALLCGTAALLATVGLGDRITLITAGVLAAGIAIAHRILVVTDRAFSLAGAFNLPEALAGWASVQKWLATYWLPDYASLWSVHALAGGAALGALMMAGPRIGRYLRNGQPAAMPAHNLPMAGIGALLLWVGAQAFSPPLWQGASVSAFSALLTALLWTRWRFGKTDPSFAFTGFWSGLIAGIGSGVSFLPSLAVGVVAGIVAVAFSLALDRRFVDDPVGIVAAEGLAPLLGITAQWFWGEASWGVGVISWGVAVLAGFVMARCLVGLLRAFGVLRPAPADELAGTDLRLYGIAAYPEFELREA